MFVGGLSWQTSPGTLAVDRRSRSTRADAVDAPFGDGCSALKPRKDSFAIRETINVYRFQ